MSKWVEQLNSRQILSILYGVCIASLFLTATGAWFVRDNNVSPTELLTLRWIWMTELVMFITAILLIGRPLITRMVRQNEKMHAKQTEMQAVLEASKQNETKLQYRNELIEVLASKESLLDYSAVIEKIVWLTEAEFGAVLLVKDNEITSVVPKGPISILRRNRSN